MINKVISTIRRYGMIEQGSVVVAAVSGGSDSMAMLHILNAVKNDFGFSLKAVHVNHGIRGNEADDDERFVSEYCKRNGIPLDILKADVISEAQKLGVGLEEAGRKIRYDFFASQGNVLIATAHNLTDRAETFLFNFARGSALRGLGSIPPVRDNFIRPLIDCSKAEIEEYCSANGVPYVTDKTNADVTYSRNRIRHNVLPELRIINNGFENAAARCIDSLREDEKYLSECADELVMKSESNGGYDARSLASAPAVIRKRALVKITEKLCGVTPEYKFIDELCFILENGGSRQINGGEILRVRRGLLERPVNIDKPIIPVEFEQGSFKIGSCNVCVSFDTDCLQNVSNCDYKYFIDYDKISGKAFFRGREQGDKICIKGRGCTKTLKKLFNELSIPPEKRDSVIVLADESGVILAAGAGIDSRVAVNSDTKNIAVISFSFNR